MRTSSVLLLSAALVVTCAVKAGAQTAVETFKFIISGTSKDKCGEDGLSNYTECNIQKSDDTIVITYTDYDLDIKRVYRHDGQCLFSIERIVTSNKNSESYGKSNRLYEKYDFTGFYAHEVAPVRFFQKEVGSWSALDVIFSGVKKTSDDSLFGNKTINDASPGALRVTSPNLKAGKERYEAAIKYFKENYCSGSAF